MRADDAELSPRLEGGLDADQADAIRAFSNRTLVVAGAGSGKTRVLTYGLAHLVQDRGWADREVLLLTFTRKAAMEMRQRAEELLGRVLGDLRCGTFHAVAAHLLREMSDEPFSVIDEQEALLLLADVYGDHVDPDNAHETGVPSPQIVVELFSAITERHGDVAAVLAETQHGRLLSLQRVIGALYEAYMDRKRRDGLMDYADVLARFLAFLASDAGSRFCGSLRAVLIDEAQDLNPLQREIVDRLCAAGAWQIMVGDVEQSIYGFRQADYQQLFRFAENPSTRIVKLEKNYRSYAEIVHAAGLLVPRSTLRLDIDAVRGQSGCKPRLLDPASTEEEFELLCGWASNLVAAGVDVNAMAVLARQHSHLAVARSALASVGIPVRELGRSSEEDFQQARALLLAMMRLAADRWDRLGWQRLLPMFGMQPDEQAAWLTSLEGCGDPFGALTEVYDHPVLRDLFVALASEPPSAYLWRLLCAGTFGLILTDLQPDPDRHADLIDALCALAGDEVIGELSGAAFLDAVIGVQAGDRSDRDGVSVGTVHAAKGLEWEHLFLVRVSVGAFPSVRLDRQELAEERRLAHVAMTRAASSLTVSRAAWLRSRFAARADFDFFADRGLLVAFEQTA